MKHFGISSHSEKSTKNVFILQRICFVACEEIGSFVLRRIGFVAYEACLRNAKLSFVATKKGFVGYEVNLHNTTSFFVLWSRAVLHKSTKSVLRRNFSVGHLGWPMLCVCVGVCVCLCVCLCTHFPWSDFDQIFFLGILEWPEQTLGGNKSCPKPRRRAAGAPWLTFCWWGFWAIKWANLALIGIFAIGLTREPNWEIFNNYELHPTTPSSV